MQSRVYKKNKKPVFNAVGVLFWEKKMSFAAKKGLFLGFYKNFSLIGLFSTPTSTLSTNFILDV